MSCFRGKTLNKPSSSFRQGQSLCIATRAQLVYAVVLFALETLAIEDKQSVHYNKN